MPVVLIKGEIRHHTIPCEDKGRDLFDIAEAKEHQECQYTNSSGKAWNRFSLTAFIKNQTYQKTELGFLDFKTVRQ